MIVSLRLKFDTTQFNERGGLIIINCVCKKIIILRAGTWFDFHIDDEKCVDDVENFLYEFGLTRYDSMYNTREFIWGRCLSSILSLCDVFVIN